MTKKIVKTLEDKIKEAKERTRQFATGINVAFPEMDVSKDKRRKERQPYKSLDRI